MRKVILSTAAVFGLMAGVSAVASASPATNLVAPGATLQPGATSQSGQIQQVDYYYNHHRYRHRRWDSRRRRWRYW
jgi:hypothetical protein